MAISYDSYASSGSPVTTDDSWTHTLGAGARGVLVFIIQSQGAQETVSVTAGGVEMTALTVVDGSSASEPAFIYPFFLTGDASPGGGITIAWTDSGSANKVGASYSVIADAVCAVDDQDFLVSSSQDDPSITLTATADVITFGAIHSGLGLSSNVTAGANHTKDLDISMTGDSASTEHRSSGAAGAGSVAVAFTTSAAEDVVMSAIAIKEAGGTTHNMAGTANGAGTLSGAMDMSIVLAGTSNGAGTLAGAMDMNLVLAGDVVGTSSLSGEMDTFFVLSGTSAGAGSLSGSLTILGQILMEATINGVGALSGSLAAMDKALAAVVNGTSTVTGALGGTFLSATTYFRHRRYRRG